MIVWNEANLSLYRLSAQGTRYSNLRKAIVGALAASDGLCNGPALGN
jgi:hypothetical protein